MITKRGQMYSYDVLLAVAIFIIGFVTFYVLVGVTTTNDRTEALTNEGSVIAAGINVQQGPKNVSFVINNEISIPRYVSFANLSYDDIRSQLGLVNDFCLYFEDKDGNLIILENIRSVGSSKINLSINNEIVQCNST